MLKVLEQLAAAIKDRPEAVVAAIAMLAPAVLIPAGVNPWAAVFVPFGVYIIYCWRATMAEKNAERQAEMNVEALQAEGDRRIQELAEKYLKRLPAQVEKEEENG